LNRLWLQPIVNTDPDVTYFHSRNNSLTNHQKDLLKNLAEIARFKATSDLPNWLTVSERQELQTFLVSEPIIKYYGQYNYLINEIKCDFSEFIKFPKPLTWLEKVIQFIIKNMASLPITLKIFDKFSTARIRNNLKSDL